MARELSPTLEAIQKWGLITRPYVTAKITNKWGDVIRYAFESLYGGEGRPAEKLIGSDDVSEDGYIGTNRFMLTRFQAEKTGTIDEIRVNKYSSGVMKVAIYADDEEEPGALLNANNDPGDTGTGWTTISLPVTNVVEGTYYWLAFQDCGSRPYYHTASAQTRYRIEDSPDFTFPDPAGGEFTTITDYYPIIAGWLSLISPEPDDLHTAAMPSGDGSLIRLRIDTSDSKKLYYQRITSPDPSNEFYEWTYLDLYNVIAVASCAYEAKVSQFYIDTSKGVYHRESTDSGASWGAWALIGASGTTAIGGMAAAYKPNGDLAVFICDQSVLYFFRRVSAAWQARQSWGETTGTLTGVAVYYDSDFMLALTGQDSSDQWTVWTLIYGDDGLVTAGDWGDLEVLIFRETTEPFEYHKPFIARPDHTRLYFVEKHTLSTITHHIWYSHMPPSATFDANAWLEPVPMEPESPYGLAITKQGSYAWLTNANRVFRALATEQELDLTPRLLEMDSRDYPDIFKGSLKVVIDNTGRWYDDFDRLGQQLEVGIGYVTGAGNEYSNVPFRWVTKFKLVAPPWYPLRMIFPIGVIGTLKIETEDAWTFLYRYRTRRNLSWAVDAKSVKELLQFFIARAGLDFDVISQSDAVQNFKPAFEVRTGTSYRTAIKNLLKMVPDQLVFRDAKVLLRNPTTAEAVDWTYHTQIGTALLVFRGEYGETAIDPNRAEVWGDTLMVMKGDWSQIGKVRDRLSRVTSPTYPDITRAGERADAELRRSEILTGEESRIIAPTNCGLEGWDVLLITDANAGVSGIRRRVRRIKAYWNARHWQYQQIISLGAD